MLNAKLKAWWQRRKNEKIRRLTACPNCGEIGPAYRFIVTPSSWMDYGEWMWCLHRWHYLTGNTGTSDFWRDIQHNRKFWHSDFRHECYLPKCLKWEE